LGDFVRRILYENGLSFVMFGLFFVFVAAQSFAGFFEYNRDQREHGQSGIGYVQYLGSGQFVESVFENWESEFLQMGLYVLLTAFLYQKGSSESKDPEAENPVDTDPTEYGHHPESPWPVRKGGVVLKLYENSLSLAFVVLFFSSFALHAIGGVTAYNQELTEHGAQPVSVLGYFGTSRFWFESLQNWQSEFFAMGAMVVLSIWLRQRGSPESKPVASEHGKTGSE
jgi:hypothetical protein